MGNKKYHKLVVKKNEKLKKFEEEHPMLLEYSEDVKYDKELDGYVFDFTQYLNYYADNLQRFVCEDDQKYYEGISVEKFIAEKFPTGSMLKFIQEVATLMGEKEESEDCENGENCEEEEEVKDCEDGSCGKCKKCKAKEEERINRRKDLVPIQILLEKNNLKVSIINAILLAYFIKEKAKRHYLCLLRPQIKDILMELANKNVKGIAFFDDKGETITSCNLSFLVDAVMQLLKENSMHKVISFVTWEKYVPQSILQSIFVNDMADFFHYYFPKASRKRGAYVSVEEQNLIMWLMNYVGLYNGEIKFVFSSRFRQLRMLYKKMSPNLGLYKLPVGDNGKYEYVTATFLTYEQWQHLDHLDWSEIWALESPLKDGEIFFIDDNLPLI